MTQPRSPASAAHACDSQGSEIAALITSGCIIGSHEIFSEQLQEQLHHLPRELQSNSNYAHWIFGSYLITGVLEDEGELAVRLEDAYMQWSLHHRLVSEFEERGANDAEGHWIEVRGRRYALAPKLALEGAASGDLLDKLRELEAPATIVLRAVDGASCGEDNVAAVNLTRCIDNIPNRQYVHETVENLARTFPKARAVEITHYNGGPCDPDEIVTCLVLGGNGPGWTVVKSLRDAVKLAASRAAGRLDGISPGQTVELEGLHARPELNGEMGLALHYLGDAGRWYASICCPDLSSLYHSTYPYPIPYRIPFQGLPPLRLCSLCFDSNVPSIRPRFRLPISDILSVLTPHPLSLPPPSLFPPATVGDACPGLYGSATAKGRKCGLPICDLWTVQMGGSWCSGEMRGGLGPSFWVRLPEVIGDCAEQVLPMLSPNPRTAGGN